MNVVLFWLRLDLRRRWRSLAVLALLIAFATVTVLASVAGARRGDSAVDRLWARTLPATAVVLPNQPGFDWDQIRAMPQVASVGTFAVSGFAVDGLPEEISGFPLGDHETLRTVERAVVVDGRMLDHNRVDEVVVSPGFPEQYGKGIGDHLTIRLATPEQIDKYQAGASMADLPPSGPVVRARIVGIVKSGWYAEEVGGNPGLQTSPALFDRYRANIMGAKDEVYVNALVRLKGGERSLAAFRDDLARVTGRSDIDVWNWTDRARHAQKVNGFEAACLLAFGLAALIAAMVLVGQSVARYTAAAVADLQVPRAVGMTRRQAVVAASVAPALAALLGGTVGVAGAVVVSHWFPIGAAATVEPDPGISVDWAVLGVGWVAVPAAVLATAAAAAWLAMAAERSTSSPRRSTVATAAAAAGLPVPVVIGSRFAFEPGRGRSAIPVRPALFGAITGVLGVLAALTFSAGVSDAASNPARFGQTHQLEAFLGINGHDLVPVDDVLPVLARDRDVTAVNDARIAVASVGEVSVTVFTLDPVRGRLPVVLTDGQLPTSANEVVLAPSSARELKAEVGSTVRFAGNKDTRPLRVAGIGFVPAASHNEYDEGGWLTPAGYSQLFKDYKFRGAHIVLRSGADPAVVLGRVQKELAATRGVGQVELYPVAPPPQLAELRDIRVLPVALGGFLALLAIGAVGHALATAVRRRRYEMAVLRAVGMTRTQSRLVVVVQATLLAAVGLLFGVPLGLALGRTLWRLVADNTPLYYEPPLAFLALVLVAPIAILVANVLAALPGRRAARLRIGHILRAE